MRREDKQQVQMYVPSGPCSTVELLLLYCRSFFMGAWQLCFFKFKNKILACTFNVCRWLIMINKFSVVAPCKSPAFTVSLLVLFPDILVSSLSLCSLIRTYLPMQQFLLLQGLAPAPESAKSTGKGAALFPGEKLDFSQRQHDMACF